MIGYEYEQRRRPSVLQDTWWFQDEIPVRRARFVLRLPKGWEFQSVWLNRSPQEPRAESENQSVWELEDIPAIEPEPAMPPWRAVAGRLAITYFPSGASAGKRQASWRDVGQWYFQLAEGRRRSTPEIQQKVTQLTSALSSPLEKIQALATFVQKDIRYVAIEIGLGGYQPHAARDIFANRYGDCKDKATLLSTMLWGIGIESYYVLANSQRGVVAPKFASMLSFNHVILAIRLPKDVPTVSLNAVVNHPDLGPLLFFDPTDPLTPLAYLPPTLQANEGLLVKEDGGELLELPLVPPTLNRLFRAGKLELTLYGTVLADVQEIRWGAPAAVLRAQLLDAQQSDRQKVLEKFLGEFLGGFLLQGVQVENLEAFDKPVVLRYRFVAQNYAKLVGDLMLIRLRVLGQKGSDLLEKKARKYPVQFPTTTSESDIFDISLPSGFQVDELPPPVQVTCGSAEYKSKAEVTSGVLRYSRNYIIESVMVPTERLEELKNFYRQVAADERANAVLKRSTP